MTRSRTGTLWGLALALAFLGCDDDSSSTDPDPVDMGVQPVADMAPPANLGLEVLTPTEGAFVTRRVEVTGRVTGVGPGQVPAVQVNGTDAEVTGIDFVAAVTLEAGPQTIVVTAGSAEARVEVTVDDEPPRIDIHAPIRGRYISDGQTNLVFDVTDDLGLATLTLNGRDLDTGRAPNFEERNQSLAEGLNILQLEAADIAGNASREHVAALHGPLRNADEPVESAIRAHIGTEGLAQIGRVAAGLLDEQNFAELLPDLFESGGFQIQVSEINYRRPAEIELTPMAQELHARITLHEFTVQVSLAIGGRDAYDVGVGAGRIEVNATILPRVDDDGQLVIDVEMPQVDFFDLDFRFGGVPEFEDDPDLGQNLLEEILGDTLSVIVEDQIPDLLASALSALDDPIDLELLGAMLQLQLRPNVVVVSQNGLSIRIDVTVALLNPPTEEPPVEGYVGRVSDWDGVPQTDEFGLAVDDDLINALLYQIWRSGALFPVIDQAAVEESGSTLRFVTAFFGSLVSTARPEVPRNAALRVATRLPLPIVATVKKGGGGVGLEVGIGDLALDITTDDADQTPLLMGSTSMRITGELGVLTEDGALKLALNITETVSAFDVLDEDLRGRIEAQIEGQIGDLLEVLGPTVADLVGGFELPSLMGITLADVVVDSGGPDGDFIFILASLEE